MTALTLKGNHHDKTKELQKNTCRLLSWLCDTGDIRKLCSTLIFNIQKYIRDHP